MRRDLTGTKGRLHHITYALDSREEVLRAADIFLESGVRIETGPHKHAIQQSFSYTPLSRAETVWRFLTPAPGLSSLKTGSRFAGRRPSATKVRRGH